MREPRNPFRLRASESIESDGTFLRLFGPGMLDLLPSENLWDKPQVFRSAPGGGKTSLLRLFTPSVLLTLHRSRRLDDLKELWGRMRELELIDDSAPQLLGVYLSCVRNYATLDDMELDNARRDRILFGLLNARITLACVRAALQLSGLSYPDDLAKLTISPELVAETLPNLAKARDGRDLFEWAVSHETMVCDAIDSFGGLEAQVLPGDDSLSSLRLMKPGVLMVEGRPISSRTLLMLDDLQQLTHRQRSRLLKTLAEQRSGVAVWLAERFEALSSDEMLASGTTEGRDYEREVLIERFWRKHPRRFESLVMNVANRRAAAAVDVEVNSLDGCLQSSLDGLDWAETFRTIAQTVQSRVLTQAQNTVAFSEWIDHYQTVHATPRESALNWRTLEILVAREQRRKQVSFDFPLSRDVLATKEDSQLRAAAELFLATEFKLPYYFGSARLAVLASSNLEQFLRLAGDEFEEVVATRVMRKTPTLSPKKQDGILNAASESVWAEIARRARFGDRVSTLLDSISRFCAETTYQPNAPYDPGVTGIAISMRERQQLLNQGSSRQSPEMRAVLDVLAAALAQNLLEPILDYRVKGDSWMVLYLNRILCVRDRLPLHYGGFKEKTVKDLYAWSIDGYRGRRKPLLA